jgi:hypothetical protein
MKLTERETLHILKFELKFLEDGGYGRSPRTPWRPSFVFVDSPTCLNFDDSSRSNPCTECSLMQFVPEGHRLESVPCWTIPIGPNGQTVENLYGYNSQEELEEALKVWLRAKINKIEAHLAAQNLTLGLTEERHSQSEA